MSVQGICEKTALAPSFSNSNFILSEGDYFSHHLPSTDQIKIVYFFFTGSLDHRKTSGTVVSLESMKLAKLILFRPWTVRLETIRAPRLSGLLLGHRVKLLFYSREQHNQKGTVPFLSRRLDPTHLHSMNWGYHSGMGSGRGPSHGP